MIVEATKEEISDDSNRSIEMKKPITSLRLTIIESLIHMLVFLRLFLSVHLEGTSFSTS